MTAPQIAVSVAVSVSFDDRFPTLFAASYRVAYRLLGSRPEAEDVASEACARACARWRSVGDYADAWCVRVAGNLALDVLRARTRAADRVRLLADVPPLVASEIDAADRRVDLYRAMRCLPRRQREVVTLRFLGDLGEEQVADLLGISVGSVKTHASRGVARLREVLAA